MARIPQHVIDEVIRRLDIVDLVGEYVQLKKKGSRFWGLSPFKTEKTPSFSVDPEKQLYYCFSTQQGGTAINFLMQMEGVNFPQAIERLAQRVGIALEEQDLSTEDKQKIALQELYERVSGSFSHIFWNSREAQPARQYMSQRGFSREVLEEFRIGFCPSDPFWLHEFLHKRGYSTEILANSGLFTRKNPRRSLFSARVVFPIQNDTGKVVAFGGRALDANGPKYINSPETALYSKSRTLYGFWQARQSIRSRKQFFVVEGYMDLLAMHQGGFTNTVAPLGTAFTAEQIRLLSRFSRDAVLVFDSDAAGYKAAYKSGQMCVEMGLDAKAVQLNPGEDPADLLQKGGLQAVENSVSSPLHVLEYLYSHISSNIDSNSVDGKSTIIRELAPFLSAVTSAVQKEASFAFLGERLGIDPEAIRQDVNSSGSKSAITTAVKADKTAKQAERYTSTLEMFLMTAAIANSEMYPYIRKHVTIESLQDEHARDLCIALEEGFRTGDTSSAAVVERIEDTALKAEILRRLAGNEYIFETDMPIKEAVQRLKDRNIRLRKQFLQQELQSIRGNDMESIDLQREIMAEIIHLDAVLREVRENADEGNAK